MASSTVKACSITQTGSSSYGITQWTPLLKAQLGLQPSGVFTLLALRWRTRASPKPNGSKVPPICHSRLLACSKNDG
jgi:hypothetical protein